MPLPVYQANLAAFYAKIAPRTKHFLFATTTPVPAVATSYGRSYELAVAYNDAARAALTAAAGAAYHEVDLWSTVIAVCGANYTACPAVQIPANVHFEPEGQELLGQASAAAILNLLGIE